MHSNSKFSGLYISAYEIEFNCMMKLSTVFKSMKTENMHFNYFLSLCQPKIMLLNSIQSSITWIPIQNLSEISFLSEQKLKF